MKLEAAHVPQWLFIWLVALLPLVVLLSGVYFAVAQPGCVSCHARDARFATATNTATHANVKCVACHVSPAPLDRLSFGFREVFHMEIPLVNGKGRDWAAVGDTRCLSCHKEITSRVVSANGIRIKHASCDIGAQCTDCHSGVAHGSTTQWVRTYDMEACLACHASQGATTKCNACHDARNAVTRVSTGVFGITHGKQWRVTHGTGNLKTCSACHVSADCAKCHGAGLPHDRTFLGRHAAVAVSSAAKCSSCHEQSFCSNCHGLAMPHTSGFTKTHAKLAASDPKLCQRCHATSDCTNCHVAHVHPGGAVGNLRKPTVPGSGRK